MSYKVYVIAMFLFLLSCNSRDSSHTGSSANSNQYTAPVLKNLSYDSQIAALFDIFRIAQSAAVPKETMDSVMPAITDQRLQLTKDFVIEYTKRAPDYINDKFLSKPDQATLEAVYYLYFIGVDAFANGAADPLSVIKKGTGDMSDRDLLINYYKVLFMRMHRTTGVHDFSAYSVDFDKLSLGSAEEQAILYYISMSYFGAKYNRLARNGCERARAFADKMPRYEGKEFYAYKMPAYSSFDVIYDQLQGRVSVEKAFEAPLLAALDTYNKCN
jgi:hypothetical protein